LNGDNIAIGIVVVLGIIGIFILWAIGGALIGAFAGWIVSKFFLGQWIVEGLKSIGFNNVNLVHFGALLGFVAGFFKRRSSSKKD